MPPPVADAATYSKMILVEPSHVSTRDEHTYTIKLDRLGGVSLTIELPPQEEIPEDEYRRVFREMFSDISLSPEVIDEVTFEYTPIVW